MTTAVLKPKKKEQARLVSSLRSGRAQLRELKATIKTIEQRLEDLDDLKELVLAMRRNAGKPSIPLRDVAEELGLN
jgi:uncharacterized protein YlxW (UPF0749 family)